MIWIIFKHNGCVIFCCLFLLSLVSFKCVFKKLWLRTKKCEFYVFTDTMLGFCYHEESFVQGCTTGFCIKINVNVWWTSSSNARCFHSHEIGIFSINRRVWRPSMFINLPYRKSSKIKPRMSFVRLKRFEHTQFKHCGTGRWKIQEFRWRDWMQNFFWDFWDSESSAFRWRWKLWSDGWLWNMEIMAKAGLTILMFRNLRLFNFSMQGKILKKDCKIRSANFNF